MKKKPEAYTGTKFNISTAYALSVFSNLAYKSLPVVQSILENRGFEYVRYIESKITMTQGYVAADDENIVVFFRGTRDRKDIRTDLDIIKTDAPSEKKSERVHRGFMEAWESVKGVTTFEVKKLLKEKKRKVWITGHSLGAAISGLAAFDLQENNKDIKISGSYLFGMPRMCNVKFSKHYNKKLAKVTFRLVNNNDVVTRIPLISMGYRHVGQLYYFDSDNKLRKEISWFRYLMDRFSGRFKDAFDGDIDSIADHSMPLYSKHCLANM